MREPSVAAVFVGAATLLLLAYAIVFTLTIGDGFGASLAAAAANVAPLAALSAATYALLKRAVLPLGVAGQTVAHLMLAPLFAVGWYALILVALALGGAVRTGQFSIGGFSAVAFIWQMFQGCVIYALVAATSYALRGGRTAAPVQIVRAPVELRRYLTRIGDELVPVAVEDIVLIRGAQDYAEVVTADGSSHLVRLSLAELVERLPGDGFVRVHRSAIVNIAHLGRAEPIGSGRMALHLAGGSMIETSRSGAQALRGMVL